MGAHTAGAQTTAAIAVGLARFGDRPALRQGARSLSYAELDALVTTSRDALGDPRVTGIRHLIHLTPDRTIEFVVAWLAALSGGHVVLINSDPVLASTYGASITADTRPGAGLWMSTGRSAPKLHPDLRLLLSTSGSTGSPKLVRLCADNLNANAEAIATYLNLGCDDVALTTLPLDYCYGLSVLNSHLIVGGSLLLDDRSVTDPGLWDDARRYGVTSFAGVPYTFDLLEAAYWPDLPSLRRVTQAGGRMAPERVRTLAQLGAAAGWDFYVMYGQTEATARMTYLPPHLAATHPGSVGIPIPGGSVRIEPVPEAGPGTGELVYTGPNVMMGYAETPADLVRGYELDELRTGDLARIDDGGLIHIVGRRSRFAKVFGQRIDLDRLQGLLAEAGYQTGCVESKDAEQLVIATEGRIDEHARSAIISTVRERTRLPAHAVAVVPQASLPRLPNGKVDLSAIAESAGPAASGRPGDPTIAGLFEQILDRPRVRPGDSFVSLHGDSLSYVELSIRLEERIEKLPPNWPHLTVQRLTALAEPEPAPGPRILTWVDTTIILRAVAIVAIVGAHTNLWTWMGGAHVLLAVVGANFARFQLVDEEAGERRRRVLKAASRVAIPAVVWIGIVNLMTGQYPWRTVFLLNDVLGSKAWSEPAWHYWFLDVVVVLFLAAGLVGSLPWFVAVERRHKFAVPAVLAAATLVPPLWARVVDYDGDLIHSSVFIAWIFFAGWAASSATHIGQRLVISALVLLGLQDFSGDTTRDAVIGAGLLTLVWFRTLPLPQVLLAPAGVLASASLFIYLTHWQVYPHLEYHWPLGGLLASLAVGLLAWQVASRVSGWARRLHQARPHHVRTQLLRQEVS